MPAYNELHADIRIMILFHSFDDMLHMPVYYCRVYLMMPEDKNNYLFKHAKLNYDNDWDYADMYCIGICYCIL